jgi:hypothetical protein
LIRHRNFEGRRGLKIRVSVVRFRPWAPLFSMGYADF